MAELTNERKVALLSGHDDWHLEAVPELGLPAAMVTDGPHGLRKAQGESLLDGANSAPATCFPTASALGASWDRELLHEVGVAIAREARTEGVAVVLGPGVNMKRHPACGRSFEYFSEDPLLSGELAAAFVQGVQSLGVGTSLKHFAVNNQESHRMVVDVVVDERTLREIYLPAFEITVTKAQPWTVMCAYNRVNGTYCAEHPWLLTTVLRDEWGFEGLLVTDWGANDSRVEGIRAGMDLEMPGGASAHDADVLAALADGRLAQDAVDRCVDRVVHLLERSAATAASDPVVADPDASHALARRAAAASAVLLTNDGVLPLDPGANVAVIGDFAVHPRFQGGGSSQVNARTVDLALDEVRRIAAAGDGRVRFAAGYDRRAGDRPDLIDEAVSIARTADVAVVFAGLPPGWETEGMDREHLRMPDQHNRLIEAVAAANPRTVVVLSNGAPVAMPWVDRPAAVVEGYLGGQASGGGIADVLYGVAEPGGRLAETFPVRQSDVASDAWFPGEPRQVQYREGLYVGYRWFDTAGADVLFPFGHGLSYTTFALTDAALSASAIDAGDTVRVSAQVANTGARAGSEVVQVYVRPIGSPVDRPDRELRAFDKVHLAAGASTAVELDLGPRAFAHWDTATHAWQIAGGDYEVLVGRSSRAIDARLVVSVRSDFVPSVDAVVDAAYRDPSPDGWVVDDAAFTARLGRPLPEAEPVRPFHRNSTLGDVGDTTLGRPLLVGARKLAARMLRDADTEGGLGVMVDHALVELPLRNLAAMSRGKVTLRAIDKVIAGLNRVARPRRRG